MLLLRFSFQIEKTCEYLTLPSQVRVWPKRLIKKVNRGYFVFHFGSSIGTHQIEIRQEDNGRKVFPVVVI